MSLNIVDLVKSYVTPDLISKAGSFLGEDDGNVSKAVTGIVPTILSGITSKATSGEQGASGLLDTAKSIFSSGLLSNAGSLFGNSDLLSKGSGIISSLFGGQSNSIMDTIGNFAGIKSSSASSLFSFIGPLILGLLGKHATENNLSAGGFSSFLSDQKSSILNALPSGLSSLAGTLGLGSLTGSAKQAVADTYNYVDKKTEEAGGGGMKWLLPLLLIAAALIAAYYLFGKGCNKTDATATDTTAMAPQDTAMHTTTDALPAATVTGKLDSVTGNYVYDVGAEKEIKLNDGTIIKVGENSTEAKLLEFLNNGSVDTVDKSKGWITLDRVYFNTGKSTLTDKSLDQLKNIAAILKNFPTATVKMGGYTDNTGAASLNVKLSGDRAKIAAGELTKLGVAAANVASEGYGPEHPVCAANDTPECKAQNRRVDIRVTKK